MGRSLHVGTLTKCPANVTLKTTRRQRTDSRLKWLLNERAALAGKLANFEEQIQALQREHAEAQEVLDALTTRLAAAEHLRQEAQDSMTAMETVVGMAYPTVDPAAAGVVHAWAGRYGKRGDLKRFALATVAAVAPGALTTGDLLRQVIGQFGLVLSTAERDKTRFVLRRMLQEVPHLVEELPARTPGGSKAWRWRSTPGLSELLLEALAHDIANQDPAGSEMGGQRACGRDGRD